MARGFLCAWTNYLLSIDCIVSCDRPRQGRQPGPQCAGIARPLGCVCIKWRYAEKPHPAKRRRCKMRPQQNRRRQGGPYRKPRGWQAGDMPGPAWVKRCNGAARYCGPSHLEFCLEVGAVGIHPWHGAFDVHRYFLTRGIIILALAQAEPKAVRSNNFTRKAVI